MVPTSLLIYYHGILTMTHAWSLSNCEHLGVWFRLVMLIQLPKDSMSQATLRSFLFAMTTCGIDQIWIRGYKSNV